MIFKQLYISYRRILIGIIILGHSGSGSIGNEGRLLHSPELDAI